MTGQTQNTGKARTRRLVVAAIAVAMLATGMSAGYAIASLDQTATPSDVPADAAPRIRSQAAATAIDADGPAGSLRPPAGSADRTATPSKSLTKDDGSLSLAGPTAAKPTS